MKISSLLNNKKKKALAIILALYILYKKGILQRSLSRFIIAILNRYQRNMNKKL